MSGSGGSREGLNILCIDGGGARGLSALILLQEIMHRVQVLKKLDAPPAPHEYFDVIAGTGTGAVQACMLGRLRMPARSAIESYASLAKQVFSEKKRFGSGVFKTTNLKESLRSIIRDATGDSEEPMTERQQTEGQCKTMVFAMSRHNMRAGIPTTFRSYPVAANEGPQCTIWETLCATMAHPDLFKAFDIGKPPLSQSFVDAGLGCNNPLAYVLSEVTRLYPERHVGSITSLGTGHPRTIQIPDSTMLRNTLPIATLAAMKNMATDAERVAEEMAIRFNSTKDVYFRLNVEQGIQSVGVDGWERLGEVMAHTRAYMMMAAISQRIDKVALAIQSIKQLDGEIQVGATTGITSPLSMIQRCPASTPMFTGCELKISRIESCITGSTIVRKVCVVHGLAGAGKTQTVLKVVERTRSQWNDVIYIDASTKESIESALREVAIVKKAGNGHEDTLRWLEMHHEPWLIVFDNADDSSLPFRYYTPGGSHGSVVIVTRLSGMVLFAQGEHSDCGVSSMDPDDALALLLKLSQRQDHELSPRESRDAKALLEASERATSESL